jgi:hypothetical protein
MKLVGARRVNFPSLAIQFPRTRRFAFANGKARPRLPDSESGGFAFPREPRADEICVPDGLCSGDFLHERKTCSLKYTTGTKWCARPVTLRNSALI